MQPICSAMDTHATAARRVLLLRSIRRRAGVLLALLAWSATAGAATPPATPAARRGCLRRAPDRRCQWAWRQRRLRVREQRPWSGQPWLEALPRRRSPPRPAALAIRRRAGGWRAARERGGRRWRGCPWLSRG